MLDLSAPPVLFVAIAFLVFSLVPVVFLVLIVRSQRDPKNRPRVFLGPLPPPRSSVATVRCGECGRDYEAGPESCPHCARGIPKPGELDVSAWSTTRVTLLGAGTAVPYLLFALIGVLFLLRDGGPFFLRFMLGSVLDLLFFVAGPVEIVLFIAYILIIAKSPIPDDLRPLWVFGFIFGGSFVAPATFYYLVWEPRARYRRLSTLDRNERRGLVVTDRRA